MKNTNKIIFTIALLFICLISNAQKVEVYKINDLLSRIHNNSDTTYIVNFWATWCKPCVLELPDFEKIHQTYKDKKIKVLLVSMDFKEELDKKVKDFLNKNSYTAEIVLLDEVNGNEFINKVYDKWSGAIPATLFTSKNSTITKFHEGKLNYEKIEKFLFEQ